VDYDQTITQCKSMLASYAMSVEQLIQQGKSLRTK
jgi:hypothetical protein